MKENHLPSAPGAAPQKGFLQIEFLRVIGCLAVVLLHFANKPALGQFAADSDFFKKMMLMTSSGQKAVDLFFIISGFFFALTLKTENSLGEFLKKKLIRLYPVFLFLALLCFIGSALTAMPFYPYDDALALFGFGGTPITLSARSPLHIFWYVSTVLWITGLFFYCRKHFSKPTVDLFIGLAAFFSYAFILHAKKGAINHNVQTFDYIYSVCMLRGFGGLGIGYFIGEWYKANADKIKSLCLSWQLRLILAVAELGCLAFIIRFLMLHKPGFKNHFLFIIAFTVIIVLFLINQGYISKLLDNKIWLFFARYTYSIYLTHFFIRTLFKYTLWKNHKDLVLEHPELNMAVPIIISIIFGVITYHLVEVPMTRYLTKLCNRKKDSSDTQNCNA